MKLTDYIEDHITFLFFSLIFLFIQSMLLYFLGNNFGIVLIIATLWFFIFFLYFCIDFTKKRRRMKQIQNSLHALDKKFLLHEVFPRGGSHEELFYKKLLHAGNKSMLEHVSFIKRERQEYQEYIEQWVHEIKTPIAAMKLWSENQEGERKRDILKQIERLEHFVEQALYYARSENVENDFRIARIDLLDCIRESLLQCKYLCTSSRMHIELQEHGYYVYTDEKWLIFILNQIIENAVKYRREEQAKITITMEENEKAISLIIRDNGKGICAEDLPRVFEKGFTGENGRTADAHATGIGLYLCHKLCNALEIDMYIKSKEDFYTNVILSFSK